MDAPIHLVPAFFSGGSGIHWIIVLIVALLLFGRRLPEIMRGLGGSIREFKKGIDVGDAENPFPDGVNSHPTTPPPPAVNPPAPAPAASTADERVKTAETAQDETAKKS